MTEQPEFDIYPNLDRDIREARSAPIENEIAEAVDDDLMQLNARNELPPDVAEWGAQELSAAADKWSKYKAHIPDPDGVLYSAQRNKEAHDSFSEKISRLYEAKKKLLTSSIKPQHGEQKPIGFDMHLVAIPWQQFYNHIEDTHFFDWLADIRMTQSLIENEHIDEDLMSAIMLNKDIYPDPKNPVVLTSSREYLEYRVATDGRWGFMLMQTGKYTGFEYMTKSPNDLTQKGMGSFEVEGYKADKLGIFEWLALTIQEDPTQFDEGRSNWLLANTLILNGLQGEVPYGYYSRNEHQLGVKLEPADRQSGLIVPRLAIEGMEQ